MWYTCNKHVEGFNVIIKKLKRNHQENEEKLKMKKMERK